MADGDPAGLIDACKRLGDASRGGDPGLWVDVLTFLGAREVKRGGSWKGGRGRTGAPKNLPVD